MKVFQPSYFAREDTRTPAIFAAVSVVLNIAFSLLLFPRLGHVGIAWATTISGWANVLMLVMTLAFWRELMLPRTIIGRVFSLVAVSMIMGIILFFLPLTTCRRSSWLINCRFIGVVEPRPADCVGRGQLLLDATSVRHPTAWAMARLHQILAAWRRAALLCLQFCPSSAR